MSVYGPQAESRWWRAVPWTGCLVALGLGLRCYHYLRDPSVWHDEAALALNVLGKSFAALLGRLFFSEAAPPLFLWVEKAAALALGDGTYALRLVPFLAGCLSLVLLVPVARRLLPAAAVPWAVLLFACSDNLLWHACEAKPYAVDVLCATALLAAYALTSAWPLGRRLALFTLLAPPLLFLAYPGCFLYGGLLVALLPAVWQARRRAAWVGYAVLVLAVFGAFAALYLGPVRAQRCPEMTSCWLDLFAPWDRPWKVPLWAVVSTFEVGRYCCRPTGHLLLAVAAVGAVLLGRRGRRDWVVLLTVPAGLALVAALGRAYPYGPARVLAYAAPAFALLTAAGVPPVWGWLRARSRPAAAVLAAALLAPALWAVYHVAFPWDRADCAGASAYVLAHRRPGDRVAGNHWEYLYYFRRLGPALVSLEAVPWQAGGRLWLVVTGADLAERRRIARALPPGDWRPAGRHEFAHTTVFLLERPAAAPDPTRQARRTPSDGGRHGQPAG